MKDDSVWQQEYVDPVRFELENPWGPDDAFFLSLARRLGGPVLDIGCGIGRLARAIADHGIAVTGLEPSSDFLNYARLKDLSRAVTWVCGEIKDLPVDAPYRLIIMTGHAFQHIIGDGPRHQALITIQRHLSPDGYFAFDAINPVPVRLNETRGQFRPMAQYWVGSDQIHVESALIWHEVTNTATVCIRRHHKDGRIMRSKTVMDFSHVKTIDAQLNKAEFTPIAHYGDWDGNPLEETSPEIITLCRRGKAC